MVAHMDPEQIALLQEWHRAQATLAQWTEYERGLRDKVVHSFFGDYGDGTRSCDVGSGYVLRNVNSTNYTVADGPAMRQMVGHFIAFDETKKAGELLIKDTPKMSRTAYKALPAWGRKLFDQFVTSKPNASQLKLVLPGEVV